MALPIVMPAKAGTYDKCMFHVDGYLGPGLRRDDKLKSERTKQSKQRQFCD